MVRVTVRAETIFSGYIAYMNVAGHRPVFSERPQGSEPQ
jgi:hypothetical protein